jgi:hypothetical protein
MGIEVVDTNVWVNMDKIPPESEAERECILACIQWGSAFSRGSDDDKIAVDDAWAILKEYRRNIKPGGLAERYLNDVFSQPITRLELVHIEFDENGHAIVDQNIIHDPADHKFVAVSLKFRPPAPLVNATDTDWTNSKDKLNAAGIPIRELCPRYLQEKV